MKAILHTKMGLLVTPGCNAENTPGTHSNRAADDLAGNSQE